ncbi:GDSL-type esterase/lipase family protein [Paenibacillus chitinolyticus]|uniref:GDSL-type esterase/lipase family protein n=1 Tax=Paenibacillus chitinolyticus TaxID=79263 RepID=UPI0036387A9A
MDMKPIASTSKTSHTAYKKWAAAAFAGLLALSLSACGTVNQENGQKTPLTASQSPLPTSSTSSYKTQFKSVVFLGDSITEGLSFHDVLDKASVLAGAGKTAEFCLMTEDIDDLTGRNPKQVFLQLGSDDILWPTENPKEYSLKHYKTLITKIKEKLSNAKITILTVTPVTEAAEKKEPRYKNIADYNQGLKELAASEKTGFVDLTSVIQYSPELYDSDGIHFKSGYYTIFLDALKDYVK